MLRKAFVALHDVQAARVVRANFPAMRMAWMVLPADQPRRGENMTVYAVLQDETGNEIASQQVAYAQIVVWLEQTRARACTLYNRPPREGGVFLKTLRYEHGTWS